MPIDPKEVKVGHCYAASDARYRKVTAIVDGRIRYEAWGEGGEASSSLAEADLPTLDAFARAVERGVPCPDISQAKPSKAEG